MRGRIELVGSVVVVLGATTSACGGFREDHEPRTPEMRVDVQEWERAATVAPACPQAAATAGPPCGLLADSMSPAEASVRLADRYPFASIAEMRGTCGLDPSCEIHTREMIWLESHNRHVAKRSRELQARYAEHRHDDRGPGRVVGFALGLGVGFVGVALGASRFGGSR